MTDSFEQFWMRRAKTLTQALIISGTINIGLLGSFVCFILKEKQAAFSVEPQQLPRDPSEHISNEKILQAYSALSFQELLLELENTQLIEEGYTKRDLALASLVAFHHFHIDQAIGGMIPQKRKVFFRSLDASEAIGMTAFPALTDEHFRGILTYAKTEKWPLTSKGLFFEIKRSGLNSDPFLLNAFYTTPEYHGIYTFLQKTSLPSDPMFTLSLMIEGEWDALHAFCDQQRLLPDFSVDKRRAFLLSYFDRFRSKTAAVLLTFQDLEYVSKRLDDSLLVFFLSLITKQKTALETIAKDILISPRSDEIRKKSASILYDLASESFPEGYQHQEAVKRFCPEVLLKAAMPTALPAPSTVTITKVSEPFSIKEVSKTTVHVIQQGDSLWKISRKYKVTVDSIKNLNQLETDKLKVGRLLQIPIPPS